MKKLIKILIVEDEGMTALMMKRILENIGYAISDVVASGEKAISSVKQSPPDIILMDIRLSGEMDGIEAAREIRRDYNTPVIFVTGYSEDDRRKRAMELNPIAYLIKPVSSSQLADVIGKWFHIQ